MSVPAFAERGQGGTAVLLLHGIGGGKAIWSDALDALAGAGYRAVAMDFPGYGGTPGAPTLATMVDAVAALQAQLGAARCVLVGHSMGGMVVQEFLARGGSADAAVLACTSPAFGRAEGDWQARFVAERLAPLDAGLGMAGMAARLVPGMVAPAASETVCRLAIDVMSAVPEASYRSALQAIVAFDRREALAHIAVPVLCLAGEHDRTAPPAVMQRMAQRIEGAHYLGLPDAGHIANIEQPAAFNAALVSFLQRRLP